MDFISVQDEALNIACFFHSRGSFLNFTRWLADARALASPHLVVVLVGNKSDKDDDREVEWEEASRWAAEHSTSRSDHNCGSTDYVRCPFSRNILFDRRQRGGAVSSCSPVHFIVNRIGSTRSREGGKRCELWRSCPSTCQ